MKQTRLVKQQQIWKSALLLAFAGIFTKILSAAYRVPFQNIAGDIGFYIYQQVYPFYGVALVLSTYGFPVIISKLVAEQHGNIDDDYQKIISTSFLYLSTFFIGIFLLIFTGAEEISRWMGDQELATPFRVVSFSFLFVPFLSIVRGYFQGQHNMTPTAISQIGEQLVRVITILLFTYILIMRGYSSYISSAGAIGGSIAGGFCGSVILLYFWTKYHKMTWRLSSIRMNSESVRIGKILIIQGFTICISSLFLLFLQIVDALTIYYQLVHSGHFSTLEAKIEKGIFDRGQPLIQLGTIVATSLSLTLVPLLSSAKAKGDTQFIQEKAQLAIRVSITVGLGAALGLIAIIEPTNLMLFTDKKGSVVLAILSITILFSSLIMTTSAILQGLGQWYAPAVSVMIGVICKFLFNTLLLSSYGTYGAAFATVFASIVVATLQMIRLKNIIAFPIMTSYVFKTVHAGIYMFLFLWIYQNVFAFFFSINGVDSRMLATFQSLSSVLFGGMIYLFFIVKFNVFSVHEWTQLPFGNRLLFIMRKKPLDAKEGGYKIGL